MRNSHSSLFGTTDYLAVFKRGEIIFWRCYPQRSLALFVERIRRSKFGVTLWCHVMIWVALIAKEKLEDKYFQNNFKNKEYNKHEELLSVIAHSKSRWVQLYWEKYEEREQKNELGVLTTNTPLLFCTITPLGTFCDKTIMVVGCQGFFR